jgi:Uncharacterized alpha/beta hydrolase domain (DUF2235)
MLDTHKPYKRDECIPCGAVIKMGFFFDGFGRNRDQDDPDSSRYSNICRLWEAHRDNDDSRRDTMPNQFWYPFYYSGLGTPLNKEAENNEIVSAAAKAATSAAKLAAKAAEDSAKQVTGVSAVLDMKKAPGKAVKQALSEAYDDMSWRPVARIYDDIVKEAKTAPAKAGRVLTLARGDRWVRRGKAAVRAALYDIKKNPLKAPAVFVKAIAVDITLDSIPFMRDNAAVSMVFGTGVEDRLQSALKQFEAAYRDAKSKMEKVQRIEVSVFGADRGGVIARAFVNELVRKYKRRTDLDLRIGGEVGEKGDPIEIRFLGLLDAVSSIMAENQLLSFLPVVSSIKQNYKDRQLGVPAAVQRCVHFAAAHELRFYQRLDSLEKTRGDQYLYPGTSEDITGGAPPGSLGFRAELQRVALRDMLHEALMAGSAVDMMEYLVKAKGPTFRKFTLATPVSEGSASYKIPELIQAYRELVPREKGLNFQAHMQVFLRWLAVRYQSPAFRMSVTDHADEVKRLHFERTREIRESQEAYDAERRRVPSDRVAQGKALRRLHAAREAQDLALPQTTLALSRPFVSVWDRIGQEAAEQMRRESIQAGLKDSVERIRKVAREMDSFHGGEMESAADIVEATQMSPEALALAQAWKEGAEGRHPLPEKVMALFDMLVHDTMLTSWHDHVLSSILYFQTRVTDAFGESDETKEKDQRTEDEQRAHRVDRMPRMGNPGARPH